MKIKTEGHTHAGHAVSIEVERDEDSANVSLRIEATAVETLDDRDLWRSLTTDEALELAAALKHYAREQHRRWAQ